MKTDFQDPNLVIPEKIERTDVIYLDAAKPPFRVYGLLPKEEGKCFWRLPESVAERVSDGVFSLGCHTAGGRIRFSTDSPFIVVSIDWGCVPYHYNHFARSGEAGADLYRNEKTAKGISSVYAGTFLPTQAPNATGFVSLVDVGEGGMRSYTVNLPLYAPVKTVCIGIKEGSSIGKGVPYINDVPVVYYGSSITQGGCTSRAGCCYEALISQALNLDYVNLGFSGSAKAEPVMVDYLSTLSMSLFVCDYDHNAPNAKHLRETLPHLYETIRKAHPNLPYVFMSAPRYLDGEAGWQERHDVIENFYRHVKEDLGDENVFFVDGMKMMNGAFKDACSVDNCHPNDLGFSRMAAALLPVLEKVYN